MGFGKRCAMNKNISFNFFKKIKDGAKKKGADNISPVHQLYLIVKIFFITKKTRYLFRDIKSLYSRQNKSNGPKILLHLVRPWGTNSLLYFESILAHALNIRGADASLLVCDGILPSCDSGTFVKDQNFYYCRLCKLYRENLLSALSVPALRYSEFLTPEDLSKIDQEIERIDFNKNCEYTVDGIDVSFFAKSSTIRYFLKGFHEDNPRSKTVFKKKMKIALIELRVAQKVYEKLKPDMIITLHGMYSTWGPFYEYFNKKGTRIYVYGKGTESNLFMFNPDGREFENMGNKYWKQLKNRSLTPKENEELDNYLKKRFSGEGGDLKMYMDKLNINASENHIFNNNSKYKRRYALFTNLPWDAVLMGFDTIFTNAFEWVYQTIDYFINKPEYQLIIKVHPAEMVWEKGSYSFMTFIKDKFKELPHNITLLPANTSIKPYDLFPVIDAGLVYNGTLGLEMATVGVPVLVAGKQHYTDKDGIIYKIKDMNMYFSIVENLHILQDKAPMYRENARKYAYLYFIKYMIPISFFDEENWFEINWERLNNLKKIIYEDEQISNICDCIIKGNEILRV